MDIYSSCWIGFNYVYVNHSYFILMLIKNIIVMFQNIQYSLRHSILHYIFIYLSIYLHNKHILTLYSILYISDITLVLL